MEFTMKFIRTRAYAGAMVILVMSIQGASAITARDVTDKMSKEERYGYLTGVVDTVSYQSLLAGNRDHARCVSDAFYKEQGGLERIISALHAFPDKAPVAIVHVVLKKACDIRPAARPVTISSQL